MTTSRLQLYNEALMMCGERQLATLADNIEPRHLLDSVWSNDGVRMCLQSGQWRFAMRGIRLDYTTSITPPFGYRRGFAKPSDWCLTAGLCSDEFFNAPLLRYMDEAGYWYADLDTIYLRYVSDDVNFGGDFSLWPANFMRFAAADFASRIVSKLTQSEEKEKKVLGLRKHWLLEAKNTDAFDDPTKFPAQGMWTSSRRGRNRRDRGNLGSLIG